MQRPVTPNDEISLIDLWQILIRHKWWVLGTPLLAVIAAGVAVFLMKPQWEAAAVVQVGAVGQAGPVGQAEQEVQLIEPVVAAMERMKHKAFEDAVLAEVPLVRGSLTVKALPHTDMIQITVRGYSQRDAKRSAEATVSHLRKVHDKVAAPKIRRLKQRLAQVEFEIDRTKAEREMIFKMSGLKAKMIAEEGFMDNLTLANIMIERYSDLRELEHAKLFYTEQLDPMRTYPTSLIEDISVSEKPVSPKKARNILLVGILGLILGVIGAFLSDAVQLNRRKNP
jgi:capsular polysaccharide biosynthesis protein